MKITAFLMCISGLALGFACGSSKDGESGLIAAMAGTPGTAGTAGGSSLVVGDPGVGGGSAGSPAKMGGVVALTPAQVTAINNNACDGWSVEPESKPAVLEFVVDTSLSMNEVPGATNQPGQGRPGAPAANGPTKWVSTRDALKAVISTLPDSIAAG